MIVFNHDMIVRLPFFIVSWLCYCEKLKKLNGVNVTWYCKHDAEIRRKNKENFHMHEYDDVKGTI